MSLSPREKKILVIGDVNLCIIGAAAGTDYIVFRGECDEIRDFIRSNVEEYGVYIVTRDAHDKCKEVFDELEELGVLKIVIDSPKIMKEIDPRKYYEELMAKFVGMKISL